MNILRSVCFWLFTGTAGLSLILFAMAVACVGTGDHNTVRHIATLGLTFLASAFGSWRFWIRPVINGRQEDERRIKRLLEGR